MEEHYGEYWYLTLLLSAVLTWGIGLAPPLLFRFAILKRPISKKVAITLVVLFWFLNVLIFTALGSTSKTHSALFFVAWASFAILRKGSQKQKRQERPINIKEGIEPTVETTSDRVPNTQESNLSQNQSSSITVSCDKQDSKEVPSEGKSVNVKEDMEATSEMTSDERPNNAVNHIDARVKQGILVIVLISLIFLLASILAITRPHSSIAEEKSAHPETPTSGEGLLADLVADIQQTRNLSTPSKRIVGRWRNVDYDTELYFSPIESELGIGTYRIRNRIGSGGSFGPPTRIRILRENVSGTELFYKEFKNLSIKRLELEIGLDLTKSDIRCCVSMDGTTMTLEYTSGDDPDPRFSVYRYIDNEPLGE